VGSHLGWHSTMCWPRRGGRGTQYTQKPLKHIGKKKFFLPEGGCPVRGTETRPAISQADVLSTQPRHTPTQPRHTPHIYVTLPLTPLSHNLGWHRKVLGLGGLNGSAKKIFFMQTWQKI
jgi:hypothetical protein